MGMTGAGQVSLRDLQDVVGVAYATDAAHEAAVDGVSASFVVEPDSIDEVAAVLRLAARTGAAVAPRGSGTTMSLGNPPARSPLILSTARLDRVLEHAAGDLVARVEAGVTLQRLQATLAGAAQMLAVDPPERNGTLGGIIAANIAGPRRLRYGTVRDLLIGITAVLADGTVIKAGGKVVKNVAGYDLCKLFTGSLGTLGVIVEAIVRLHPLPAARRTVMIDLDSPETTGAAVAAIMKSVLVPSALELQWTVEGGVLMALFEGIEPGVEAQAQTALRLLDAHGSARILDDDEERRRWDTIAARPWGRGGIGLKICAVPADLPRILHSILSRTAERGLAPRIAAHAGTGVTWVGLPPRDDEAVSGLIQALRGEAVAAGGSLVVAQAPPDVKRAVDVWGQAGDALPLMRRVKEQFDPQGLLNPGRFVGGI